MSAPTDEALRVLAHQVGERLRQGRDHLVTAESCTGGWIAKCVTDIAGSSDWFDCGLAAYSYEAKQALLGVRPQTLETHGAVSRETVIEMVSGALVNSGASVAVDTLGRRSSSSTVTAMRCAGKRLRPHYRDWNACDALAARDERVASQPS